MQPTSRLDALEQPAAKRTRSDVPSGKAGVPLDEELSNSRNAPAAGGDVVDLTADSEDEQAEATDAAFRAELARFTAQQEEWQRQQRAAAPVAVGRPAGAAAARGRGPAANAPLPPALYADIKKAADEGLDVLSAHRFHINGFLKKKAECLHILRIEENPHSRPGTPLYERFVKAWATVRQFHVELVFHGTPERNIQSICRQGLDPKRRAGQAYGPGEYFGGDASISMGYCQGGSKMLVFAVLLDKTGLTHHDGQVSVIHRPEFQLPLFTVSFDKAKSAEKLIQLYQKQLGAVGIGSGVGGYAVTGGGGRAFAPAMGVVLWGHFSALSWAARRCREEAARRELAVWYHSRGKHGS